MISTLSVILCQLLLVSLALLKLTDGVWESLDAIAVVELILAATLSMPKARRVAAGCTCLLGLAFVSWQLYGWITDPSFARAGG